MPQQKDLKRLVRTRMQKTGESYTAARLQLVRKVEPPPNYAELAGTSDDAVKKQTGRDWAEWVCLLDAAKAHEKPHREIAIYVSSLGVRPWWTQNVTVGYERIKGLRAMNQRRGGAFEANKSRTLPVPVERLFAAFADDRLRRQWLDVDAAVRSSTPPKRVHLSWPDGTSVQIGFTAKGDAKSMVAVQHEKLPDRAAADAMKKAWGEWLDRLAEVLGDA